MEEDEIQKAVVTLCLQRNKLESPKDKEAFKAMAKHFGWFGGGGSDPNKITDQDITTILQDANYVRVPFRLLSATIVAGATWRATDFSKKNVLKRSVKLLEGVPAFLNHDTSDVNNMVGKIEAVKFTPAFTAEDGTEIPAGLDGVYKINTKLNGRIAAYTLDGTIDSSSVTVAFDWDPSHTFETSDGNFDEWKFFDNLGTIIDDEMVRRIATKITQFHESSLVFMGADPFAGLLDEEGKKVNLDKTRVFSNSEEYFSSCYAKSKKYFVSACLNEKVSTPLSSKIYGFSLNEPPKEEEMKEILIFLAMKFGKDLTEVEYLEKLKAASMESSEEFSKLKTKVAEFDKIDTLDKVEGFEKTEGKVIIEAKEISTVVTSLKESTDKITELNTTIESNKVSVELATTLTDKTRKEALKVYKLSLGENSEDEGKVKEIEDASFGELEVLVTKYGGHLIGNFNVTCPECEAEITKFHSASDDGDGKKKNKEIKPNLAIASRL